MFGSLWANGGAVAEYAAAAVSDADPAARAEYDVAYVSSSHHKQILDLYLPARMHDPAPLVIWVHGGGWRVGDKSSIARRYDPSRQLASPAHCAAVVQVQTPEMDALNAKGYAVAAINYRLDRSPTTALQDAKAAVRFLRANAARYHLDPNRFAAWGDSAGAYTVIMLGVTGGQRTKFDDPALGNLDVSAAVHAVVDWFGPTDSHMPGNPTAEDFPYTYIRPERSLPPFMIAHGDEDCVVPVEHSRRLRDALVAAGGEATLTVLPGAAHEDPAFMRTQLAVTYAFLDRVLGR